MGGAIETCEGHYRFQKINSHQIVWNVCLRSITLIVACVLKYKFLKYIFLISYGCTSLSKLLKLLVEVLGYRDHRKQHTLLFCSSARGQITNCAGCSLLNSSVWLRLLRGEVYMCLLLRLCWCSSSALSSSLLFSSLSWPGAVITLVDIFLLHSVYCEMNTLSLVLRK